MKKTMIIAIALASITATAQTSAPAQAAAPVKKKAAVSAKKASAKKAAAAQAAVAQTAPQAAAVSTPAPETKVASADVQTTPASAGTSSVNASAQATPKKWSAKAQLYSTTDFTNTQNIQNLTTFSGSYKVLPKLGLKVGQTFETLTNGRGTSDETRELTKSSNFRTTYTDLGVSTSLPGFAGSDELPLSANLRIMGGNADYTTIGEYSVMYNLVDVNFSVPFTISPKWAVSIDTQWRTSDWKEQDNKNRLIAGPNVTYTINDYVSIYHAVSWIGSFKDAEDFRRNVERFYMETGVTVVPVKNLSMTFMVDQDKAIYASPSSKVDVTNYSLYKPNQSSVGEDEDERSRRTLDAVAYEAVIAYTF